MQHRLQFVTLTLLGISSLLTAMIVLRAFTLDLFVILSFVAFVFTVEFTAPDTIQIPWRRQLTWLFVLGLVVSTTLLGIRIVEFLPDRWISFLFETSPAP